MKKQEIRKLRKPEIEMVSGGNEIPPGTNFWEIWPFYGDPPLTSLDGN